MVKMCKTQYKTWIMTLVLLLIVSAFFSHRLSSTLNNGESEIDYSEETHLELMVDGELVDEEANDFMTRARTYVMVDTGQEICYNNDGEIMSPLEGEKFYGQDAHYNGLPLSYLDNGDGTVTDLNTGLMWQEDPNNFDKVSWDDAMANAATVTSGSYNDWRVPTIKELYSLMDFSGKDPSGWGGTDTSELTPFIDTNYFGFEYGDVQGERVIDSQYWSSNEYVSTTMNGDHTVFGVNFADGRIKGYGTSLHGSDKLAFVQYVRGGSNYGVNNFMDNGDGTITDQSTGLMWMKNDSGSGKNWSDALDYSENLVYASYNDWRLPNAKELQGILDYTRSPDTTSSPAIDPVFNSTSISDEGSGTNWPYYWTGTTHVTWNNLGKNAAYISFGDALGWMEEPPPGSQNYNLMDVHGAGSQRSDPKEGNPGDYPYGHGPQGDVIRIFNYVRCVRDINSNNTGPEFTSEIQSVSFPEDGSGIHLLNISEHFTDDVDLKFRIDIDQKDGNIIGWEIDSDGYHLNFDAPVDWFGKEEFKLKAYDTGTDGIFDNADDEFAMSNWFNVTVTPTNDPPEIISVNGTVPSAGTMELPAYPGQELNITIVASDEDGDSIKYSSNSSIFSIHVSSGRLTGTPANEDLGIHWINITGTEVNSSVSPPELLFDFIILKINIRSTNERPEFISFIPAGEEAIDFIPGQTVLICMEDDNTVWTISYFDPDGDTCTFSSNFTNQRFELDGTMGTISFTPIQEDVGNHYLNITITDQWLRDWVEIVIRVENVNDPPEAKPIIQTGGVNNLTVSLSTEGAYDEDGDELNYSWELGDGRSENGLSVIHTYAGPGNYTVILAVSDGLITTRISKNITVTFTSKGDMDDDTDDDVEDDGIDDDVKDDDNDENDDEKDAEGSDSNLWIWIIVVIVILIISGLIVYISTIRNMSADQKEDFSEEPGGKTDENDPVKWE